MCQPPSSNFVQGGLLSYRIILHSYSSYHFTTTGPDGPVVDLGHIKLQGTRMISASFPVNAWLGVCYATSPTGQLQFSLPQPIEGKWRGK